MDRKQASNEAAPISRRDWLARALAAAGQANLSIAASAAVAEPVASRQSLAAALLARNHQYRPEFRGGFSNHLSMGLYSLSALGGDEDTMKRFADAHWAVLDPLPKDPGPKITRENWGALLGRREALNGYRAFFGSEIARLGRAGALRQYLPSLLPGVAAGGFHALIRTGYGVRFADDQEVMEGLTYWATAFLPLGPLGKAGEEHDPRRLLQRMHDSPSLRGQAQKTGLVLAKMKAASALPGFGSRVDALRPDGSTLGRIAAAAVRMYLHDGDFTALHAVTGTHANRLLSPFVSASGEGVRYFWQALAAAYVSIGAPPLTDPGPAEVPAWEATIEQALGSLDDHDLKFVDIAREEEAFYGDPIYRLAAAHRMRLA
jgi:hypothetical protein